MPFFRRNLELGPALRISPWRKIAVGSWKNTGDSSVYGLTVVDVEPAQKYLEELRQKTGVKVTLTQFVGKAVANTYRLHPDMNVIVRWGRIYPRKTIDLFFQVAMDTTGEDLSGALIKDADKKSLIEISQELSGTSKRMRGGDDVTFKKIKKILNHAPGMAVPYLVRLTDFLLYDLNLWAPFVGTPRNAFGSVMLTSIGSLGLSDIAYAPIPKFSHLPMLLCLGAAHAAPVVRDGQLRVGQVMNITFTLDHRYIDGVAAGKMLRTFSEYMKNPHKLES